MMFLLLLLCCVATGALACDEDYGSAFNSTGIACRITKPAALVLNEQTTKVIEAAFTHAKYPDMGGEKSILFIGKVRYGLNNLWISNVSIGKSEVELREDDAVGIDIANVSATFKGTLTYGYGNWLVNLGHSLDFEIESQIDLEVNTKLYCRDGRVAADTSDCYLTFHRLLLHLQGDRQPGWIKKLFTDFVSFTVKLVIKSQICKEINNLANILAGFIQERAELFLSDGDIGVDISITASPVLKASYIESHHKGLARLGNATARISDSAFSPALLTESRMLYFWISDQVLGPLVSAAHRDGRFVRHIAGEELQGLFRTNLMAATPDFMSQLLSSESPEAKVWSLSDPQLWTTPQGTFVRSVSAVELKGVSAGHDLGLHFETEVEVVVRASYADKKLFLDAKPSQVSILKASTWVGNDLEVSDVDFLKEVVEKIGVPKVVSYLEPGLTALMDSHGLSLFELIDPEVVSQQGYVIVQLDFGFPHHLLVEFLQRTL
ncbi:cholesteryl ester transfer protein isoform X2 [Lepisosteus oculatus]|uniref:cholesteryl ester transfer protein isoform X2 n=1 Tax=Lepisosteus oculatus TaxID=7918 RepID=UPI0035F509B6